MKSAPSAWRRSVIVDGIAFSMEVEPQGGYIVGYPLHHDGTIDTDEAFELDSRAFKSVRDYDTFREAIRFLLTYQRG